MQRRAIQVRGIVQGVGFRPYVFGLASQLSLRGFVRNQAGSVAIEVEGQRDALDSFLDELTSRPPPLARIQEVSWQELDCLGQTDFHIEPSQAERDGEVFISPDIGTCDACLAELFDPADRRYRYPFTNCTHCGPRLTIITGAPYDRPQTTMAGFAMCDACRAEYENPADRRFHAQPIACPECGPSLQLLDAAGERVECSDPLADFARSIAAGMTGAMKGLGGFHLVCDATNAAAVQRLRQRKHRDEKPLAIMFADVEQARCWCDVSAAEQELLESSRRPIVLLRKCLSPKDTTGELAPSIAPRNPWLGLMLPYTPLHHLLLDALDGRPLVMTSGNQADEPIAYRDADAPRQLAGIADCFLTHDRPIHVRCDDSLVRMIDGRELPIRRSRGYAPEPIGLPLRCPLPVLVVGGQLKGTFALSRGDQAIVSHHLGDLDHYEAYRAFVADIELYERLFDVRPKMLVHDLHPDYGSTRYARQRAAAESLELLGVQHHHAHLASCLADNGLCEPAIGVTFDGTGYGLDGAIWGGEFLVGDYAGFRRAAHLRYIGMPGGEQAVREPWRMALAHLLDAGCDPGLLEPAVPRAQLRTAEQMLAKGLNSPPTSSVGRLFDAVAALAGLRHRVNYEGQAAVELEWLASEAPAANPYPYEITSPDTDFHPSPARGEGSVFLPSPLVGEGSGERGWSTSDSRSPAPRSPAPLIIDTRPLVRALAADCQRAAPRAIIARAFHETLADIICEVCTRLRIATGLNVVALTGGVFLNAVLTGLARQRLEQQNFRVITHARVPPNDGGLSLGQLAIAAHALQPS